MEHNGINFNPKLEHVILNLFCIGNETFHFLGALFSCLCANAQRQEICFHWNKTTIPIYADQLTDSIYCHIYQDFELEDHAYEAYITDKSPLRFKIEFRDLYDSNKNTRVGWIDKKYCTAWDRVYYDDIGAYIKLYESPNSDTYLKIRKRPECALTVVDFQDKFLHVILEIEDVIYDGWIDRYCCNIFNSCT